MSSSKHPGYENTRSTSHFDPVNKVFFNPWQNRSWAIARPSFSDIARFAFAKAWNGGDYTSADSELPKLFPVLPLAKDKLANPPADKVQVTWIGHASSLVQIAGVNLLTDPVFCDRVSPIWFAGPKRLVPLPFSLAELRKVVKIDCVVISHNHYDHLDKYVVQELGDSVRWFVPLQMRDWFEGMGVKREQITTLDWWQGALCDARNVATSTPTIVDVSNGVERASSSVMGASAATPPAQVADGQILVAATPAQHWSKRTAFDTMQALWASWSVIGPVHRVHFCGDTGHNVALRGAGAVGVADAALHDGYHSPPGTPGRDEASSSSTTSTTTTTTTATTAPVDVYRRKEFGAPISHFREIGDVLGPFTLSLIPIGAYEPRGFLKVQHINPEEAVCAHVELRSRWSLGVHWATFQLSAERIDEPPQRVDAEMRRLGLPSQAFFVLKHGETRVVE